MGKENNPNAFDLPSTEEIAAIIDPDAMNVSGKLPREYDGEYLHRRHIERQEDAREAAVSILALIAPVDRKRWRHKKRGTTYTEVGRGQFQAFESCHDMEDVVIYRADADGSLWVRPTIEFEDGRFERIGA